MAQGFCFAAQMAPRCSQDFEPHLLEMPDALGDFSQLFTLKWDEILEKSSHWLAKKVGRSTFLASKDRLIWIDTPIYRRYLSRASDTAQKDGWLVAVVDTKMALCFIWTSMKTKATLFGKIEIYMPQISNVCNSIIFYQIIIQVSGCPWPSGCL